MNEFVAKKQFLGDKTLTHYVVPEGIREIGDWAFSGCKELTWIEVPTTLERIGRDA
ncbi:MAG: leucine-rich repeat protein, partial [Lachnospiraceae bacterium]|nr:leucine-rich repeat protein [Lachnospiraceae bacterium]